MTGVTRQNNPLGKARNHQFEVSLDKRFSKGFNFNLAFTKSDVREKVFLPNEFDRTPPAVDHERKHPALPRRRHRHLRVALRQGPFVLANRRAEPYRRRMADLGNDGIAAGHYPQLGEISFSTATWMTSASIIPPSTDGLMSTRDSREMPRECPPRSIRASSHSGSTGCGETASNW